MKIDWKFIAPKDASHQRRNALANAKRGAPLGTGWHVRKRLAVVGGAPSLRRHLDELKEFQGEIWAINGAWRVLAEAGIECALFTIDCDDVVVPEIAKGAKRAVLATSVDPATFDALDDKAQIEVFELGADKVTHGPTTATAAPMAAIQRGHKEVHFYACGGAFEKDATHAYDNVTSEHQLSVECGGEVFRTDAPMLAQSAFLAEIIRNAPAVFYEHSGGLLHAMVSTPDYDIVAATQDIHDALARNKTSKPHVVVAIPSYSGSVNIGTMRSVLHDVMEMAKLGWAVSVSDESNNADIAVARAMMVSNFLANLAATHLVMVDNDVMWQAGGIRKLVEAGVDLVAGVYPFRRDPLGFPLRWLDEEDGKFEQAGTLLKVQGCQAGFMCLSRKLLETMWREYEGSLAFARDGKTMVDLFDRYRIGQRRLGEDYSFCQRAIDCGFAVHIDPSIHMGHVGLKVFEGSLGRYGDSQ